MSRRLLGIALLLLMAYGVRSWMERAAPETPQPRLAGIPASAGDWRLLQDRELPADTMAVLHADAVLLRDYQLAEAEQVQLYVAYYRSQSAGERMHSPRNCLPGSGWEPVSSSFLPVDMGGGRQATVNRYLVQKGTRQMLVLYWYESRRRIVADEYAGRLYLLWDSLTRQDRDGAIIRVAVPLPKGQGEESATRLATHFIRRMAPGITGALFPAARS